jgi:hypothetical protein
VSSTCGGRSATDGSSALRLRVAFAPCRSRQSRLTRSSRSRRGQKQTFCFHHCAVPTSISTTSAPERGSPPNSQPGSHLIRRVYDLRRTFATFALRAGVSTFDLARYMGASLTMIDRHYGRLARDGRDHAINLLDSHASADEAGVHRVDTSPTSRRHLSQPKLLIAGENRKPSDGLEPSTPSLPCAPIGYWPQPVATVSAC